MDYITPEGHDMSKLPKWAQLEIEKRNAKIAELQFELDRLQRAHSVLENREWLTISRPKLWKENTSFILWALAHNEPISVCSIGEALS